MNREINMGKKFTNKLCNRSVITGTLFVLMGLSFQQANAQAKTKSVTTKSVNKKSNVPQQHKMKTSVLQKKGYSVQDAIRDVLESSPNIQAELSAKREAIHRIRQAESGYLPTIDLRAGAGFDYVRDKFSANQINSGVNGTVRTWKHRDASVNLTQGLFSGFDTVNKVDKAKKEVGEAQFKYEETQYLLAFETARTFVTIRRLQRLVKLAEQNVGYHQSIVSKIKNLVSVGKNTVGDSQHVQARLSDAQAALQDIKGDYASSVARFVELTGHEPGYLTNARVPERFLPKSLHAAVCEALKKNRSLGIANATVEVAKADLATTDTPFYPSVNIEANAGRNFDVAGETGHQTTVTALLVARYNLFNGFQNIEKTREYIDRVTTAKYRRDAERRRIEREIRTAWEEMNTAYQQSLALERAVTNKRDVLNSNLGQFDAGTSTFPEILNSTHEWFLAQGSKITADASQDIASLRLLTTMGKLIDLYSDKENYNSQPKMMSTVAPKINNQNKKAAPAA